MTIIWHTAVPTSGIVRIGLSANDLSLITVNEPSASDHMKTIGGLSPGTLYYIQVEATDANGLSQTSSVIYKSTKP